MKQQILLILQGIPGSGKSTFARDFIKTHSEEWIIVNRDSIRDMLGNYWVPSREKLVTQIEEFNICMSLSNGYNVIVDATNLNLKTISKLESIAKRYSIDTIPKKEIIVEYKFFEVDLQIAIERDKKRERSVGEEVIKGFYNRYYDTKKL
jgi:predicted kinase